MNATFGYAGLVFCFILIGGVFAAAEIALVSLREGQLRAMAERGRRGQIVARLARDPNRFLSAVQVGVTLAGFLASAFGGATLSQDLAPILTRWGLAPGVADAVALVVITLAIAYVSIVLGELAAKRLALQRSQGFSLVLGPIVDRIATISRPVIWFLSVSTNAVVRVLGGDPDVRREEMSEQELREFVSGHETLDEDERKILSDVFSAGDRQLREVMVPRTEVCFLDASTPVYKAVDVAVAEGHSRFPVIRRGADDVVGFIHLRDLFDPAVSDRSVRIGELAREILLFPGTKAVLPTLSAMRSSSQHMAIVVDEYGGTAGAVTLEDLVEELVGEIRDEYDGDENPTRLLVSGDIDVDGRLNLEDFSEETGIVLPEGPYETVAGFVVARLAHLPQVGEAVEDAGHRFAVSEMDGRRVARVRVSVIEAPAPAGEQVAGR
ncbi:MAG: hemolysin family protein [Nocardioidaceae bacterium]